MKIPNITDQYNDKGQYVLIEILDTYKNSDSVGGITKIASDLSAQSTVDYTKLGSDKFAWSDFRKFPIIDQNNTILSKMYFDHQKSKIPAEYILKIAVKLDTYLDLYSVPDSVFEYKEEPVLTKTAHEIRYLLPDLGLCKIASKEDLVKASTVFDSEYRKLCIRDRVEFSKNFVKCANDLKYKYKDNISKQITKYAALLETDMGNIKNLLSIRVAAATRIGQSGKEYSKLASMLDSSDIVIDSKEELEKLAEVILDLDIQYGFDHPKYDKVMPCAYGVVFNKEANEKTNNDSTDGITNSADISKSEIIGRYGHGILEEVENSDGSINIEKLSKITSKLHLSDPESVVITK